MGGRSIKKIGILVVLLIAGMLFVSGCAGNAPEKETAPENETGAGEGAGENEVVEGNQTSGNNQTIVQVAEGAGYTTFASLVRDAGLEETLNKGGPYTVFSPTDKAFDSLPEGMLDDLRNDEKNLSSVLTYHVVKGEYKASDLKNMNSLTSLEAGRLSVNTTEGGQVMVGNATVVEPDIVASNGVIHGIDVVLIP